MALSDFSGVIPPVMSAQIIQEATRQSAALSLGRRVPMGTKINNLPVPSVLPKASFVTAPTGRKPYTEVGLRPETLTAEEVAAVIAIPDAMIEDSTLNLWGYARPLLSQAIAIAVDEAAFHGVGAPNTWPTGGIWAAANSGAVIPPTLDPVETINTAMGAVESRGLNVSGHAADTGVRFTLRGVRDANGSLLLGTTQVDGYERPSIYGLPATYTQFATGAPGLNVADFVTGAWDNLVMGVRTDIRFLIDPSGVITNDNGSTVLVSGFQDNVTPMKVWARFGCVIIKPVTPRTPTGAIPFAKTKLIGAVYPGPVEGETAGSRSKK
jgi:HK97 family phage major capsid protein